MTGLWRVLMVGLLLTVAGCGKERDKPAAKPVVEPISAAEIERGHDACRSYIERLCRCAATHPEYAEECELIRNARPDALRKAIAASETAEDESVRWRTQVTARRIMSRCIEDDNRLDLAKCPRRPAEPEDTSSAPL